MTQILNNIGTWWLQTALLIAIGAVLPHLFRINGAARLRYWQSLLIACIGLPLVRPWHSLEITVVRPSALALPLAQYGVPAVGKVEQVTSYGFDSAQWILALLVAGIAVRLAWFGIGLLKLDRYRRQSSTLPLPPEWLGVSGYVQFLISDEIQGPATFGFAPPAVMLPARFPALPREMRDAILLHELKHVERGDWVFTALEEIVGAVLWFHPAIWWVLGEIQLAREQTVDSAVIEITREREPYLDTLLAMAGAGFPLDPAAAQSFLRRRQLKRRVRGIIEEGKVSKMKLAIAQMAAVAAISVAGWYVAGAIPLEGQARVFTVTDGEGVTVNLNGLELLHRSGVPYPQAAQVAGVEGQVVVQLHLDGNGEVTDSAILSGPAELRRSVQQTVAGWHFDKSLGSSTHVISIDFRKPASAVPSTIVRQGLSFADVIRPMSVSPEVRRITSISIIGLTDAARESLSQRLPVQVGDEWTSQAAIKTMTAMHAFDDHLTLFSGVTTAGAQLRISAPEAPEAPEAPAPPAAAPSAPANPNAVRISPGVAAASLVRSVKPVYPPLAKSARLQGTVKLEVTVGRDGSVVDLKVISGPPLLVSAALEAVKQWTYKALSLNGEGTEFVTTVDVNFTLLDGTPPNQDTPLR